ncbi:MULTISPECIES: hypothetical protein [Streptomyces]
MTDHPDIDPHWPKCPNRDADPNRRRPCARCAELDHEQAIDDAFRTEPADDPFHRGPLFSM